MQRGNIEQDYDALVDSVYPPRLLRKYYEDKVAFYKARLEIVRGRKYMHDEQYIIPMYERRYNAALAKLESLDEMA